MLNTQTIDDSKFAVRITGEPPTLSTSLENEIEKIWLAEQKRRGKSIFNGRIMSATNVSTKGIDGCIVEYRHLIAQRANPDLFDDLRVRPVAVSGLLECEDGIVFGSRDNSMTQDAGLWELVPSGGIDTSKITQSANIREIDFINQILTELYQEIRVKSDAVSAMKPFCLVDDTDSHVLDIGIMLRTPFLFNEIVALHKKNATKEYGELQVTPRLVSGKLIEIDASQLVGVSMALIQHYCKLIGTQKVKCGALC